MSQDTWTSLCAGRQVTLDALLYSLCLRRTCRYGEVSFTGHTAHCRRDNCIKSTKGILPRTFLASGRIYIWTNRQYRRTLALCNEGSLSLRDTESPAQIWTPGWLVCSLGLMATAGVRGLCLPHQFIRGININHLHTHKSSLLIGTIH